MGYTKGPWILGRPRYGTGGILILANGGDIRLANIRDGLESRETEANAHLMCSAPDLLEAAKNAIDTMQWALKEKNPVAGSVDPCVMACQDLSHNLSMLVLAIAKAEGR